MNQSNAQIVWSPDKGWHNGPRTMVSAPAGRITTMPATERVTLLVKFADRETVPVDHSPDAIAHRVVSAEYDGNGWWSFRAPREYLEDYLDRTRAAGDYVAHRWEA